MTCYLFLYELYRSHGLSDAHIRDVHIVSQTGNDHMTTVHCFPLYEADLHMVHEVTYPLAREVAELIQRPTSYEVLF